MLKPGPTLEMCTRKLLFINTENITTMWLVGWDRPPSSTDLWTTKPCTRRLYSVPGSAKCACAFNN